MKDFTEWNTLKVRLHQREIETTFQQREIWWCSIGVNIGHEVDGKNQSYSRPVLIIRKFNKHIFFGVPLTSKLKENPYYHRIQFNGQEQCVMLSQLRLWESKRLINKMGKLYERQFNEVRKAVQNLI